MKTSKKIIGSAILCLGSLATSNLANAGSINNCTGGYGDYGDAPIEYGIACHDTNRWQQLGTDGFDGDTLKGDSIGIDDYNNIGWSAESSSQTIDNDTGDNGIFWSVSSDGQNWSDFGTSAHLTQGQYVKFKVDAKRSTEGNHEFDEYKLWLDWYGTESFDNTDVVFNDKWQKDQDEFGNTFIGTRAQNFYNTDLGTYNSPVEFASFISNAIMVPIDAILGQTWLRARFVCENSFSGPLMATGYYHQGETEDYAIKIVQDVNAPATIALFSLALFGMVSRLRQSS